SGAFDTRHNWAVCQMLAKRTRFVLSAEGSLQQLRVESPFLGGRVRIKLECAVEQRLARQAHNLEVVGSIPTGAICTRSNTAVENTPLLEGFFHAPVEMLGDSFLEGPHSNPCAAFGRCRQMLRVLSWSLIAATSPDARLSNRRTRRAWPTCTPTMSKH